jgi:hypothetical protein
MDWIGSEQGPVGSYCNQNVRYWSSIKHDGRLWTGLDQNRDRWVATVTRMLGIGVQ